MPNLKHAPPGTRVPKALPDLDRQAPAGTAGRDFQRRMLRVSRKTGAARGEAAAVATIARSALDNIEALTIAIGAMSGAGSWGLALVADVGSGAALVRQQPQCIGDFRDGRCPQFSTQHLAARICWSA